MGYPGESQSSVRDYDELSFANVEFQCLSVKAQLQAMKSTVVILSNNGFNSQN